MTDLAGQVFGRLTVVAHLGLMPSGLGQRWRCTCECGITVDVDGAHLSRGTTRSCGCLLRDFASANGKKNVIHGMEGTPEYASWIKLIARCCNPDDAAYEDYGGRGITVCDRWRFSVEAFASDMGSRPPGMTIERVDNNKGYEPGNCIWANAQTQARNRRSSRLLTFNGETLCLAAFAERYKLSQGALWGRLDSGWPIEKALTYPLRQAIGESTDTVPLDPRSIVAGWEKE